MAFVMNDNHIDEHAFGIFVSDGIQYYLTRNPQLNQSSVLRFISRLHRCWTHITPQEKEPWLERAREHILEMSNPEYRRQLMAREDFYDTRNLRMS